MTMELNKQHLERIVRKLPVLRSLTTQHLQRLISDFFITRVQKDDVIFYHYDQSSDLYLIISGSVKASLLNPDGQELILAMFHHGDFFGEMSLLDGKPRSATMIANEDTVLAVLKRERFLDAIKADPMIAIDLLSSMAGRMRTSNDMIESLAFLDVSQRLVRMLIQISNTDGEKTKDGLRRMKKLTHRELAAHAGASREAVSKAMKVLAFKNIVIEKDGFYYISPEADHFISTEPE